LTTGNNLAITGIILQVVSLAIFAGLAALSFGRRYLALRGTQEAQKLDPEASQAPQTLRFKLFVTAVTIPFLTIFTRCVYRIAEMMGGWGNPLMQSQGEFIALDSVMCGTAALALTVFHPGWCFPQMARTIKFGKGKVLSAEEDKATANTDFESVSASESEVDVEKAAAMTRPGGLYFR